MHGRYMCIYSVVNNACYLCGLAFLFNGKSTFVGYLMAKPSFYKNSGGTI